MAIIKGPPAEERVWDLCVVGAGPVGMALALECEKVGFSVLMLESGKIQPTSSRQETAEICHPSQHAPLHLACATAFGGSSWLWGGRCVPFDEFDFPVMPHIRDSGWPIKHSDIEPFYAAAAEYLGVGAYEFASPVASWTNLPDICADRLERWSSLPRRSLAYRDHFSKSTAITLCLESQVTELALCPSGERVDRVLISTKDGLQSVTARNVVLAAGGLGTTRLLLTTQRKWHRHFGGSDGALGRFYMGHLTGQISHIKFAQRSDIDHFDYHLDEAGHFVQRRLTISSEALIREKLLNISFWPENPFFWDPNHQNGVLSLIFLALSFPPLGRLLLPEPIRIAHIGPAPRRIEKHLRNVLVRPDRTILDAIRVVWDRFHNKVVKPSFLYKNSHGVYALRYHSAQGASQENRVTLGKNLDPFGMPCLRIDFRFSETDGDSVVRAHQLLDRALRAAGKGEILYRESPERRLRHVLDQATDGFHQIGTTRMGAYARTSVVDANCRVYGITNLFISASGVFPTSSQANPTLLAAALAVRLAHYLAGERGARIE